MAGRRRRRPCAGARMPLLRSNRRADLGRPSIAPDLTQHQRPSARARRRSPRPLSRIPSEAARCSAAGDPRIAVAQPAVFWIARANREPCRAPPGALRRGDCRLQSPENCHRIDAGPVPASPRPAPDRLRPRRDPRPPELPDAPRRPRPRARRGRGCAWRVSCCRRFSCRDALPAIALGGLDWP